MSAASTIRNSDFAASMQGRARKAGRLVSVEYSGGGWFSMRHISGDIIGPPTKYRREQLRAWVRKVEELYARQNAAAVFMGPDGSCRVKPAN